MSETLIAATSEFSALFPAGAALERVATGFVWAEGGVWVPGANELRFSDIPNNRIMAWSCLLYTSPSPRDRQKSRMPSSA